MVGSFVDGRWTRVHRGRGGEFYCARCGERAGAGGSEPRWLAKHVKRSLLLVPSRIARNENSQGVEVVVAFDADLPMASPLTTSSTRRLRWRPSEVSLDATGCVLPKPRAEIADSETPCSARKSRTLSARRSESCWLKSSEPTLSVWPSI